MSGRGLPSLTLVETLGFHEEIAAVGTDFYAAKNPTLTSRWQRREGRSSVTDSLGRTRWHLIMTSIEGKHMMHDPTPQL
jgi:hypothetical protein